MDWRQMIRLNGESGLKAKWPTLISNFRRFAQETAQLEMKTI